MENKRKKDLAKIALAAFMLSASLPAAAANSDAEAPGTLLAGGGCATRAGNNNRPASSGCAASQGRNSPASSSCAASQGRYSPASSSCAASQASASSSNNGTGAKGSRNAPASGSCAAAQNPYGNAPAAHSCSASAGEENLPPPPPSNQMYRQRPAGMGEYRSGNETYRPSGSMGSMQDESSSYQGTTTGPGPNGGYPGSPRGAYNPNPSQNR